MFRWLKNLLASRESSSAQDAAASLLSPSADTTTPPAGADRPRVLAAEQQAGLPRPLVFEPALRQYSAFRAGEPQFADPATEQAWYAARKTVLEQIAAQIGRSTLREQLVLRGSTLLAEWFPQTARRPGDLDWVVCPPSCGMSSRAGKKLLAAVEALLRGLTLGPDGSLQISDAAFVRDEIWTYEKSPGVRLIVPWSSADLQGTVQLDFVFEEVLPSAPVPLSISAGGEVVDVLSASPAQSLAWKLLWLTTDYYAQGKDLYDAVLLAEAWPVDVALTRQTFAAEMPLTYHEFHEAELLSWEIDWDSFQREYPQIGCDAPHWQRRLVAALQPLFASLRAAEPDDRAAESGDERAGDGC